jgi:hypothetical protein
MFKLEIVLESIDWELHVLASALPFSLRSHTHAPFDNGNRNTKRFKFELFWIKTQGFLRCSKGGMEMRSEYCGRPFIVWIPVTGT